MIKAIFFQIGGPWKYSYYEAAEASKECLLLYSDFLTFMDKNADERGRDLQELSSEVINSLDKPTTGSSSTTLWNAFFQVSIRDWKLPTTGSSNSEAKIPAATSLNITISILCRLNYLEHSVACRQAINPRKESKYEICFFF